jgi:hypothetical protein
MINVVREAADHLGRPRRSARQALGKIRVGGEAERRLGRRRPARPRSRVGAARWHLGTRWWATESAGESDARLNVSAVRTVKTSGYPGMLSSRDYLGEVLLGRSI